jgi:hypothetical protein
MQYGYHCSSPVEELLGMIERKAPLFMRAGGLVEDEVGLNGGIPDEMRAEIRTRFAAGECPKEIAFDLGVHKQTVWRHTRDLRGLKARGA